MRSILSYVFLFATCHATIDYKARRAKILRDEALLSVGGRMQLSDKESLVNDCLMQHKFHEVDYGFNNPQHYNFSRHFFSYKDNIRSSKVYQILNDMPKGAALHLHDVGILGPDYIVNLTYSDNLYVCLKENDMTFKFEDKTPVKPCENSWKLISELRKSLNRTKFDSELRKLFTMYVDNPDVSYPSIAESWTSFRKYFNRVRPILTHRPIWEKYIYEILQEFRKNNVMYIEVRSYLAPLYELDSTVLPYNPIITAKAYEEIFQKFKKDHPDFIGAKIIYVPGRRIDQLKLEEYLSYAKEIKAAVPDIFAGFDLAGQEDLGNPLLEFAPQLEAASNDLDYFFHAGETDWYGTLTDENLVDAILLGAKRIGHGYALPKHPLLLKMVIEKDIAVEVNVVSNAVLSLVRDVRNHPLSTFLAQGVPVVISSDDPGVWEADPLTDDFYIAFVGVSSRLADLSLLKQLAINSLKYSALDDVSKLDAMNKFNERWNKFINGFNCSKY